MVKFSIFAIAAVIVHKTNGQAAPAVQGTGWNSSFTLTPAQLKLGNLTQDFGTVLETVINFDRSQLVNGGAHQDEFYSVPDQYMKTPPTKPGQVLKLQEFTDPTNFSLPSNTAISRIMYTSLDANGTLIPTTAYVLWPYTTKKFKVLGRNYSRFVAPTVLWAHGTSGFFADGAPSLHRSLFYGDIVPFTLAKAGYAVVAPDYAGLGVSKSWDGSYIPHQYFINKASAADALNALRAALQSFPTGLTKEYVVMGHSQGGAVGWKVSDTLANQKKDYADVYHTHLGTLLIAPATIALHDGPFAPNFFLVWVGKNLDKIFPDFALSQWLTPLGRDRVKLYQQLEGSQMVATTLFNPGEAIVKSDWFTNPWTQRFNTLANPGRVPFKGPMKVFQGDQDPAVPFNMTLDTFKDTCKMYPGDLEFVHVPGASHFGAIEASTMTWLEWIGDRFMGNVLEKRGCFKSQLDSFLPIKQYLHMPNSYSQWAGASQWGYEIPTGA